MEYEKIISATPGNIETLNLILNNKFQEFFFIIKDQIDNSNMRYKEELQIIISAAIAFDENFISTMNIALASFQSLAIPIDDPRTAISEKARKLFF
jgi:hypothetical protein